MSVLIFLLDFIDKQCNLHEEVDWQVNCKEQLTPFDKEVSYKQASVHKDFQEDEPFTGSNKLSRNIFVISEQVWLVNC